MNTTNCTDRWVLGKILIYQGFFLRDADFYLGETYCFFNIIFNIKICVMKD